MRIGVIAEGVTDQAVIEAILTGYFDDDDLDVAYVQPPKTGGGPAVGNAGWGMVIKQFEVGGYAQALTYNDYLVVQIDTDVSEQSGYDVSWRVDGRERSVDELVAGVIQRLRSAGDEARFDRLRSKLIFAVSVHCIECWLLPLIFSDNKRSKLTGCLDAINQELRRSDRPILSNSVGAKNLEAYRNASKPFEKKKNVKMACGCNASFFAFVRELDEQFSSAAH